MLIKFKNVKTGEIITIDGSDFNAFTKYMTDGRYILVLN